MGVYIKHWSLADWKELLKWAKIGANNAMIGEFTEVEELPPHGDLIDRDAINYEDEIWKKKCIPPQVVYNAWVVCGEMPTIIEAEDGE